MQELALAASIRSGMSICTMEPGMAGYALYKHLKADPTKLSIYLIMHMDCMVCCQYAKL
jgi:hypothetical protein